MSSKNIILTEENSINNTKFEPKYYFSDEENRSPKLWNNKLWYIIAEANVSFNKDMFWNVVVNIY
jgi:hypothetical protein